MSLGLAMLLSAVAGQGGVDAPPPVVHEQRLDDVGMVSVSASPTSASGAAALAVVHRGLPTGSFAEVTDLSSGRTIIVLVEPDAGQASGRMGSLSAGTARALGIDSNGTPAVRIRPAAPSPAEQAAVRTGTPVRRLDAPSALLSALRRRLPPPAAPVPTVAPRPATVAPAPVKQPAARPTPLPASPKPSSPAARGRWFVQVATLSDASRAASLAKSVDGVVRSAGRLYRVQAGPFATRAAAETARASIARRGFGDARIIAQD